MTAPLPPLLLRGDCLVELARIPDGSVDSVICDPPYGLEFMGKAWDKYTPLDFELWCAKWAAECLRILKPGGHILAFGGSRTWHRLAAGIEDAGFEIRDSIAWLYGSGFPKSLDVSKAIDKLDAADERMRRAFTFTAWMRQHITASKIDKLTGTKMGNHFTTHPTQPIVATGELFDMLRPHLPAVPAEIEALVSECTVESANYAARGSTGKHSKVAGVSEWRERYEGGKVAPASEKKDIPATDAAREWEGWGTALKPAFEPVVVARKPLGEKTVAANVLAHGTGALNIDATRIGTDGGTKAVDFGETVGAMYGGGKGKPRNAIETLDDKGRWPANVALDESQAAALDEQSGTTKTGAAAKASGPTLRGRHDTAVAYGARNRLEGEPAFHGDSGGASRFFYVAKAPKSERPVYWRPSCNCETIKPCAEPSPQRATDESRSTDDKSWSTSTSGKKRKGRKSRRATTSTTETATSSTTSEGTFNSSRSSSTSESIQAAKSEAANGGSPAESAASSSPSPSSTGTSLPKGGPSTVAADPAILSEWSETSVCANCGAPAKRESHATVKPLALMRWLCRLVTPPGGVVVDPFAGSGTTLEAAYLEGFESIGVEMTPEYWPLIAARIERVTK